MRCQSVVLTSILFSVFATEHARARADDCQVLRSCKAARLAQHEGRVSLISTLEKRGADGLSVYSRTAYTCYFSGSRLRMDRRIIRVRPGGAEGEILQEVTILDADGNYLHAATPPTGERVVASVVQPDAEDIARRKYAQSVWDVRMLGLCPDMFPLLHAYDTWQKVLPVDQASDCRFESDGRTLHVTYPNGTYRYTLDRDKDNIPTTMARQDGVTTRSLDVILKNWSTRPEEAWWFPESVTYTLRESGEITRRNVVVVDEATFGPDVLPASTFEVAGLGLDPGHVIHIVSADARRHMEWNGTEMIPYSTRDRQPIALPVDQRNARNRWLALIAGLTTLLVGVLLVAVAWRRSGGSG